MPICFPLRSGRKAYCASARIRHAVVNTIVSILFDGLAWAMFLFIISVGLSVTMGLMGVVNLAHGAFAMAGGYLVLTLMDLCGVPFLASLVITFVVIGAVSV